MTPAIKLGDMCQVLKFPIGKDVGVVTEIKDNVPYPYYLSSGKRDNDMGPYAAGELLPIEKPKPEGSK